MNNVQKAILIRELKHAAGILAVGLLLCVVMGLLTLQPILSIKKLLIITSAYLTFCFVRLQLLLFYGTDRLVPYMLLKRAGVILWITEKDHKFIEAGTGSKQTRQLYTELSAHRRDEGARTGTGSLRPAQKRRSLPH